MDDPLKLLRDSLVEVTAPMLAIAIASGVWIIARDRILLAKWAASHKCRIVSRRTAFFWEHSFSFTLRRQSILRLKVRDAAGRDHRCFLRIVHSGGSSTEEKIDVEWTDLP